MSARRKQLIALSVVLVCVIGMAAYGIVRVSNKTADKENGFDVAMTDTTDKSEDGSKDSDKTEKKEKTDQKSDAKKDDSVKEEDKKEVGNIPFLKQVFSCLKAFLLDREDVRQAMKVIIDVSKEVEKGRNYLIFPEGTRSKNGNKIGTFKGGSFKAATKAKCPIVPVALINSFVPFDRNTIRPVTVQVHFLKPLEYEDYKEMKTTEIAALVEKQIQETIDANVGE
jgi:hypothetical protein